MMIWVVASFVLAHPVGPVAALPPVDTVVGFSILLIDHLVAAAEVLQQRTERHGCKSYAILPVSFDLLRSHTGPLPYYCKASLLPVL